MICRIVNCIICRIGNILSRIRSLIHRVVIDHIIHDFRDLFIGHGLIFYERSVDDLHLHIIDDLLRFLLPDRLPKLIGCGKFLRCCLLLGLIQRYSGQILICHQRSGQRSCP